MLGHHVDSVLGAYCMNDKIWITRFTLIVKAFGTLLAFLYILDNFNRDMPIDSRIWTMFWLSVGLDLLILIRVLSEQFKGKPKPPEKDL